MTRQFVKRSVATILWAFAAPAAVADTIHVPADYPTIQAAIDASTKGDTILVASGTYVGPGNVNLNFGGRDIAVQSAAGAAATILDGQLSARAFILAGGETLAATIDGFTMVNCSGIEGGAVFVDASAVTIRNCVISGCTALGHPNGTGFEGGGAIMVRSGANVVIDDCTISDNEALIASGGALYVRIGSTASVTDTTFEGNVANIGPSGASGSGGVSHITAASSASFENCTFISNKAQGRGGALSISGDSPAKLTVINCLFHGNSSGAEGGGLRSSGLLLLENSKFVQNSSSDDGGGAEVGDYGATVVGCVFELNEAQVSGGGLHSQGASIVNCIFNGNVTPGDGGGLAVATIGAGEMINLLFTGNSAARGGAIFTYCNPLIRSCTFVGNSASAGGTLYNATPSSVCMPTTLSNCIVWEIGPNPLLNSQGLVIPVNYSNVQGGYPGAGNIDGDPLFVDPANDDYRLSAGSPSIDAGDNAAVPDGITTDLAGRPRFVDDLATPDTGKGVSPIVDMGAYEFQLPCPADVVGGDAVVNVEDLLAVINAWGDCPQPCPPHCAGDINDDCTINVDDMLAVISAWGPCP